MNKRYDFDELIHTERLLPFFEIVENKMAEILSIPFSERKNEYSFEFDNQSSVEFVLLYTQKKVEIFLIDRRHKLNTEAKRVRLALIGIFSKKNRFVFAYYLRPNDLFKILIRKNWENSIFLKNILQRMPALLETASLSSFSLTDPRIEASFPIAKDIFSNLHQILSRREEFLSLRAFEEMVDLHRVKNLYESDLPDLLQDYFLLAPSDQAQQKERVLSFLNYLSGKIFEVQQQLDRKMVRRFDEKMNRSQLLYIENW